MLPIVISQTAMNDSRDRSDSPLLRRAIEEKEMQSLHKETPSTGIEGLAFEETLTREGYLVAVAIQDEMHTTVNFPNADLKSVFQI
ncbi:unnamed protein product [Haemonchus placei]|uniref:DUF2958 domain-containing protein n=1 Tax=Haemonchus placei TaxID=6290 RepID=A0A0N4WGQ8_HAEPC|nr:unnamed protein product [Haemonchus placei]